MKQVTVTYQLIGSVLHIVHEATTDRTTVVNLTNHSYFRFDDLGSVNDYRLQMNCSRYAETHENSLPTGQLHPLQQTDYDFLTEKPIGKVRLDGPLAIDLKAQTAGKVRSEKSGISMKVITNQPALIVYMPPRNSQLSVWRPRIFLMPQIKPTFPAVCYAPAKSIGMRQSSGSAFSVQRSAKF